MSIRTMMTNLAQCLLLFLIFPIFILICEALAPSSGVSSLIAFLGQMPLCETLADILSQYASGISSTDVAEISVWVMLKEFPAAIIVGISVDFFINVFDMSWAPLRREDKTFKPLPILPGFLGVFAAAIVISLIGLTGNGFAVFAIELCVIGLMLFGIRLMVSSVGLTNFVSLKGILIWIIEGLYAVIVSAYVAMAVVIMRGDIPSFWESIKTLIVMAIVTLIASAVVFLVRLGKDTD